MFVIQLLSMDTTVIYDFLQELSRCDYIASSGDVIEDFRYNGIMYREGRETYNIKLNSMLMSFKNSLMSIMLSDNHQPVINTIFNEIEKIGKQYYDIPDRDCLTSMEREYQGNNNHSLLKSIREVRFLNEMVEVQRYYVSQAKEYVTSLLGEEQTKTVVKQQGDRPVISNDNKEKIIKGVDGLAKYLHIGKTKAQAIINSKILEDNKIQFYSGGHRFKRDKLDALLEEKPNLFKDITCPHKKV